MAALDATRSESSEQARPESADAMATEPSQTDLNESTEAGNDLPAEIVMCDSCYNSAIELEAKNEDGAKCDVCELRSQLADRQKQLDEMAAQIAQLEAVIAAGGKTARGRAEEAARDSRPHFMAISDGTFAKLRKYPYNMFNQIGRTPRSVWRTKATDGIEGMAKHLLNGLDHDSVAGRGFHALWFGGLTDTTKEDYERAAYISKLQSLLEKIRDHSKCLSVSWATLPETTFNAEAREINERMADWSAKMPWLRLLDLRYISRREGTMETNEAIWTPKGSQLVSESLKKFLSERLELTDDEIKSMEASAKEMQASRELKAKKQSQIEEQRLRKQQKLAKAALLKAGHPVPGTVSQAHDRRRRGGANRGKSGQGTKKFGRGGPPTNGHNKFSNGGPATAAVRGATTQNSNGAASNGAKPLSNRGAPQTYTNKATFVGVRSPAVTTSEYAAGPTSRLPASSNRVNPDYLDEPRGSKRPRYSEPDYATRAYDRPYMLSNRFDSRGAPATAGTAYGDLGLYSRRDDAYRRSPPVARDYASNLGASLTSAGAAAMYDRMYSGNADAAYSGDLRRQQEWASYDRVAHR